MKEYETRYLGRCRSDWYQVPSISMKRGTILWPSMARVCAAVLVLTGCGNAFESIEVGDWQEVGRAELPIDFRPGEYRITTLEPGHEPSIKAGNLVHASVMVTTESATHVSADVWVWTGQEPEASGQSRTSLETPTFGGLGSARLRRAFPGAIWEKCSWSNS